MFRAIGFGHSERAVSVFVSDGEGKAASLLVEEMDDVGVVVFSCPVHGRVAFRVYGIGSSFVLEEITNDTLVALFTGPVKRALSEGIEMVDSCFAFYKESDGLLVASQYGIMKGSGPAAGHGVDVQHNLF